MRGGGSRGGFGGGHVGGFRGGFGGSRGGFVSHSGIGRGYAGFGRGSVIRGSFFPQRSFYPRYRSFYGYPSFGFYASFGYWPDYGYWLPYSPAYPEVVVPEPGVVPYEERGDDRQARRGGSEERYWLIALKDSTVLAVTDYWLEGSTLHYVTRQGTKASADLSSVDLDFTKELNHERGMEFQLPRPTSGYQPTRRDAYGRPY
jgi:hypothetical protein